MTPNTGPFDMNVVSDGVSALFDRIGPGILFTHSQGGGPGWLTAIKNQNVKAIVAFEPGSSFVFPEGELPRADAERVRHAAGEAVPMAQFMALTRDPDHHLLRRQHSGASRSTCRRRTAGARGCRWRGCGATPSTSMAATSPLVHLPEIGIRGNTHFPLSDLNNVQIADLVSKFLAEKKLD